MFFKKFSFFFFKKKRPQNYNVSEYQRPGEPRKILVKEGNQNTVALEA